MIEFIPNNLFVNAVTTPTSGAAHIPAIESPYVGDYETELNAALNTSALEAAMASAGDPGGQENKNFGASMLAFAIVSLKYYIGIGKVPKGLRHPHVVGRLESGEWTLFVPASGLVMRSNSLLAYGTQTFECLTTYLDDVTTKLSEGSFYTNTPWSYSGRLLSASLDFSVPVQPAFWALHVRTAEVI